MPPELPPELKLEQDLAFMRTNWRVERAGWILMALLVLAALSGTLGGGGPLAQVRAGSATGAYTVAYERFARLRAPQTFRIELAPPGAERFELHLPAALLEVFALDRITPEPTARRVEPTGLVCEFAARTTSAPVTVRIAGRYERAGRVRAALGGPDQAVVPLHVLVYP